MMDRRQAGAAGKAETETEESKGARQRGGK